MKKKVLFQSTTKDGDRLIYSLLEGGRKYGIEILLRELDKESVQRCENLFRHKKMAVRFLQVLYEAQVYPVHLKMIAEDFDYRIL